MALDLRITDVCAKSAMNNLFGTSNALVGTQANSGILRIYADAGTPDIPAGEPSAGASHGTLLAELTLNATSFGAAAPSTTYVRITAGAITADSSANASGDAIYAVLYNSAGTTALLQGSCGVGASYDFQIDNVSIAAGANVSCSSFYIQLPKGWSS
jgi:hypothetical protein